MESCDSNKRKSRDQKFYEFFIILQKEYIVAELRKKIYADIAGKKKSEEIMAGKKKKIFDIAMKNSIKTIFPDMALGKTSLYDEELRTKLYGEIYNNDGKMPNFIYRDDNQRRILGEKDKKYYFMLGAEVLVKNSEIGNIQDVDFEKELCWVKVGVDTDEYKFIEVRRIL